MPTNKTIGNYKHAPLTTGKDGSLVLDLPEIQEEALRAILPSVTIITITKDRPQFAGLMLYNWVNIKYPRAKLEWLILDDSDRTKSEHSLNDYLPKDDPTIRFVQLEKWYPVAEKRNKAVEMATHEFIVHMDDDDYYFPDHVLAKVRLMLTFDKQGVHSLPIGVFDLMEQSSYLFDVPIKNGFESNNVAEASLAYRKDYWRKHKFVGIDDMGRGEGASFIGRRFGQWINVNFLFNMISITHTKNITGHNRRFINERQDTVKTGDFRDVFPEDFKLVLDNVRKMLLADYTQPKEGVIDL